MKMQNRSGSDNPLFADLNVTPLVDVMLVLLVIFILVAPMVIPQSMRVNLPKTAMVAQKNEGKNAQLVVASDGSLIYQEQPISDQELIAEFKKQSTNKTFQVQIQADKRVEYGRIAEIMALAQSNGVTKLSFVTLSNTKK
jgi:biopolymer transport protein ExbD